MRLTVIFRTRKGTSLEAWEEAPAAPRAGDLWTASNGATYAVQGVEWFTASKYEVHAYVTVSAQRQGKDK